MEFPSPRAPAREPAPPPRREPVRRPRRRRSETVARVLWVIPWIAGALAVIAFGGPLFAAAMALLAIATMSEFFRMTQRAKPFQAPAFVVAIAMSCAAWLGDAFHIVPALMLLFPLILFAALGRTSQKRLTISIAVTVLGVAWIAVPFAHAVLLRELSPHGGALLVDVLVATFFADTFAYLGGRMLGRRPLTTISPNKTVEGLLCGLIGGVLGFWIAGLYQDWLSGPEALLFGLCIAILAPLGDLFESAIKRDLKVKDTGRLLGPHGGLLDRLDAVLFTVIAGYYLALLIV